MKLLYFSHIFTFKSYICIHIVSKLFFKKKHSYKHIIVNMDSLLMNQFSNNKNKEEKKNTIDSIASYKGQSSHYPKSHKEMENSQQ